MTKRVDPKKYEGMKPIATGYKIFDDDWSCNGYGYDDGSGVVGSVHQIDGELSLCRNGLHFCKDPMDCMEFKPPVHWMKFAKVSAFDKAYDDKKGKKTAARTLRIDKILTWAEYIDACKAKRESGYGISDGCGISNGSGISYGYGIRNVDGGSRVMFCKDCEGISRCIFCAGLEGAKLMIFNKPVTEDRFADVFTDIKDIMAAWKPDFTNAKQLKGTKKWEETPADKIAGRTAAEAYAEMPENLQDYIRAMPEFDAEIYKKITEGE